VADIARLCDSVGAADTGGCHLSCAPRLR